MVSIKRNLSFKPEPPRKIQKVMQLELNNIHINFPCPQPPPPTRQGTPHIPYPIERQPATLQ